MNEKTVQQYFDKIQNAEINYHGQFWGLAVLTCMSFLFICIAAVTFVISSWIVDGFKFSLLILFFPTSLISIAIVIFIVIKFNRSRHICTIKYFKDEDGITHIFYLYKRKTCYANQFLIQTFSFNVKRRKDQCKNYIIKEFWTLETHACNFKTQTNNGDKIIYYDKEKSSPDGVETVALKIRNDILTQVKTLNFGSGRCYDFIETNSDNFIIKMPISRKKRFIENNISTSNNIQFVDDDC